MNKQYARGWRMVGALIALAPALVLAEDAGQICRDTIIATAPDSRYTDHGNGTVTDQATGLMWKHCPEGQGGAGCLTGEATSFEWRQALAHAEAAVFAGYSDWRLPNVTELASLVEDRCEEPAINSRRFPNTPLMAFWSSTPRPEMAGDRGDSPEVPQWGVWTVLFTGGAIIVEEADSSQPLRLVRNAR